MKPKARPTTPRRRPKGTSGTAIVDAILDAAGELFVAGGLEHTTTNRIAERAGVSVGSVYQYFPNKQSIVAGLTSRVNRELLDGITRAVTEPGPFEEKLERALLAYVSESACDLPLRRALVAGVPREWVDANIASSEQEIVERLWPLAREARPDVDEAALRRALVSCVFAVRGAMQGALLYHPESLREPAFLRQLGAMVNAILATIQGDAIWPQHCQ